MSLPGLAARLRGVASGSLTAALAVAAHGAAGAALPGGAAMAQLAIVAVTVGAVSATTRRGADTSLLLAVLAAGQLLGHVVLTAAGHDHAHSSSPPAAVMLAAHVGAIAVGAMLIAAGDRLCRAVSRAVRHVARVASLPVVSAPRLVPRRAEQPLRSTLLIAASLSLRGPPVSLAR